MFIDAVFHRSGSDCSPIFTQRLANDEVPFPAKTSNVPEAQFEEIFIWYWKDKHQRVAEIY